MRMGLKSVCLIAVACRHPDTNFVVSARQTACPKPTLGPEEVRAMARLGTAVVNRDRMDEHHSTAALQEGLPLLRTAALHGDVSAMNEYANLITWYGFVDTDGSKFMGKTPLQNGQEGLLFTLLAAHNGSATWVEERKNHSVLLNPSLPFPDGFFGDETETAWLIQGWSPQMVDRVRIHAHRWKDCWSN